MDAVQAKYPPICTEVGPGLTRSKAAQSWPIWAFIRSSADDRSCRIEGDVWQLMTVALAPQALLAFVFGVGAGRLAGISSGLLFALGSPTSVKLLLRKSIHEVSNA
jgi:hypothetical protein